MLPPGQELTAKLATGFWHDYFQVRKPLNHTADQLLEPTKRNDKSLNQDNDLSKNCVNNSNLNPSNLNPKFPILPKMRGFKTDFLNICSLTCHYDELSGTAEGEGLVGL